MFGIYGGRLGTTPAVLLPLCELIVCSEASTSRLRSSVRSRDGTVVPNCSVVSFTTVKAGDRFGPAQPKQAAAWTWPRWWWRPVRSASAFI
ncbi:hypothetical protein, partial [Rhodopirellula islandica]|uniref:hypothetical protein n=1 Tax=Rhodopirellula islandica TaxID=595434 RepID=UPI000AB2BF63